MSGPVWHIAQGGTSHGPFSAAEIADRLRDGRIAPSAHAFRLGMAGWAPLGQVPELAGLAPAVPAPLPPAPAPAPRPPAGRFRCHEIDYRIHGDDMQFVEVELDPQETVVAEAGAMMYMTQGIQMETRFGDGSTPDKGFVDKLFSAGKRVLTGESLFMTHFTNQGVGKQVVAFGAPYPGKIIPLDMNELGGTLICQKDAFLCAALGTSVGIAFTRRIGAGFFGGEGFILQKLEGDGKCFIHACGAIHSLELAAGETLRVDTGCLVALLPSVSYNIQFVGGIKTAIFGGEGLFFATLTGPGRVWLQSLPFSRLADRIYTHAPAAGGKRKGEGSVLGGLGGLLNGDN